MNNKILIPGAIFFLLLLIRLLSHIILQKSQLRELIYKEEDLIGNAQIKGTRNKQEDSFSTIKRDEKILAVLADGMGGLYSGKMASKLATKTFIENFTREYSFDSVNKFLINTTHIINSKILEKIEDKRIGTTLVAVFVTDKRCYWVSVGDSNLFYYKDGIIETVNKKHIYKNVLKEKLRAGDISREEMLNHPRRNTLTSYLGDNNFHKLEYSKSPLEFRPGDKLLLCSDGVSDVLKKRELEDILAKDLHPMETSQYMLEKIKKRKITDQDNATVIILHRKRSRSLKLLFVG